MFFWRRRPTKSGASCPPYASMMIVRKAKQIYFIFGGGSKNPEQVDPHIQFFGLLEAFITKIKANRWQENQKQ